MSRFKKPIILVLGIAAVIAAAFWTHGVACDKVEVEAEVVETAPVESTESDEDTIDAQEAEAEAKPPIANEE